MLVDRFKRLGLSERDLQLTLRYIRNEAPIIIHVNLDRVCVALVMYCSQSSVQQAAVFREGHPLSQPV